MGIVGHNPTYVSLLTVAAGGSYEVLQAPLPVCGGFGGNPLEALAISPIPGFQIAFPCMHHLSDLIFSFIKVSFCLHETCMVNSSPPTTTD